MFCLILFFTPNKRIQITKEMHFCLGDKTSYYIVRGYLLTSIVSKPMNNTQIDIITTRCRHALIQYNTIILKYKNYYLYIIQYNVYSVVTAKYYVP